MRVKPDCCDRRHDHPFRVRMLGLILSTIAFFVAAFFIGRQLDGMDVPKGMTRSILVFTLAAAVSYGVAVIAGGLSR